MRQIPQEARHGMDAHLWAVLDVLPFAVIMLGSDKLVRGMNAPANALLREADALRLDGSRVRGVDPAHDAELQNAITAQCASVLRLPRTSGKRAVELSIVPLCGDCSAIVISDPARCVAASIEPLRELYGLTPAEARVVGAVVQGEGGPKTAGELGMSVNTLRRHLKSVFAKLQVERQSELVRVVSQGVASLHLDD